ncbi:hypothetical protein HPG69_008946, partial [Diceros bicornis minor]
QGREFPPSPSKSANRSQRALRSHRTKTWRRSGLLPGPGMHRGVGPVFLLGRKMAASSAEPQILVQYLVLRKDLSQAPFSWPAGALVAQACHAATAALHIHRDHPHTAAYLRELGRMRKVVLEAPDETTLKLLAETLQQKNIDYMLWLEQPENIATCIALRPYPKEEVNKFDEIC